jgi:hypothetical protein
MIGEIRIETGNAQIFERMMVEERKRDELAFKADAESFIINFKASGINDARALINALIGDISCAEKLFEV